MNRQEAVAQPPTIDYDVPFYSNTPDDVHCAQATLKSLRAFFEPHKEFGWEELDGATGNFGNGAWRTAGMMWLHRDGYEVHNMAMMDYKAFGERGIDYLSEHYSPEIAAWNFATFDISAEQDRAREFAATHDNEICIPTQDNIRTFLQGGFLVQVTVNLNRLNGLPGFKGHAILVKGYDGSGFIVHDPGLPARPNHHIVCSLFEEIWSHGDPDMKTLTAARLRVAA